MMRSTRRHLVGGLRHHRVPQGADEILPDHSPANPRSRWYDRFVQEGTTPLRRAIRRGVVGLDIGPSTVAAAGSSDAAFEPFCPSVIQPWKEQRRIERAVDRSHRAINPECFNADGRWKKGVKARNRSKRALPRTPITLSDFCARVAAAHALARLRNVTKSRRLIGDYLVWSGTQLPTNGNVIGVEWAKLHRSGMRPPEGEVFVSALKRLATPGRSLGGCFFYRIYTVSPSGRAARGTVGLLTHY
jgi:hypothetical protein